jgi:hypothetical protein
MNFLNPFRANCLAKLSRGADGVVGELDNQASPVLIFAASGAVVVVLLLHQETLPQRLQGDLSENGPRPRLNVFFRYCLSFPEE